MPTVALAEMTWQEVGAAIDSGARVVVLPVGSTEQHGPHLPLSTDTAMAQTVARLAAERAGNALVAPAVAFGTSENHLGFPGTASVRLGSLSSMLLDVGRTLLEQPFDALILFNGHAGNVAAIAAAAHELRQVTDRVIAGLTWWFHIKQSLQQMQDPFVWHAGEFETSLMLYLHPELVRMDRATAEIPRHMPLHEFTGRPAFANVDLGTVPTRAVVDSGAFGDSRLATAEKGKLCVEEALDSIVHVFQQLGAHSSEIRDRAHRR